MKFGTDLQNNKKKKKLDCFGIFKKSGLLLKKRKRKKTDCLKTGLKMQFCKILN